MYRKITNRHGRPGPLALVITLLLCLTAAGGAMAADPGLVTGRPDMQTAAPTGRVVVKLGPDSGLVMTAAGLAVRPGAAVQAADNAADLAGLVQQLVPGARLARRIPTATVRPADKARPGHLPDLALYAHFSGQGLSRDDLIRIAARLNAHPDVELAFLEPVAVPAALGFDAFTGAVPGPGPGKAGPVPATDSFVGQQGYLRTPPLGVGALDMREVPGQRGSGVTIIDIEGAWLWSHEDLPEPAVDLGTHIEELSWRNHGTAVMGELRGQDNGFGVVGIVPDCAVGGSSIGGSNTAAALAAAVDTLQPGDLILIELHAPGPNADPDIDSQFGYVPMEYWQDNFDVIRLATSRGIIVCEAAGNGFQNLDDEVYLGLFDRNVRDSGAIMCGATEGAELVSANFSNHGQRVDLNGWGWDVTTTGYGDLAGNTEDEYYTFQFSGTSSASPIVTGSVASLQAMVRQLHGFDLDARLARDLLRETGTPMTGGNAIGTRPDLAAAYDLASTGIGEITGTVTDLDGGQALAGVLVTSSGGAFTLTGADGGWRLPLRSGSDLVTLSAFGYRTGQMDVTVPAGGSAVWDHALQMLPAIDIDGIVYDEVLGGLEGVGITCTNQPVSGTITGSGGTFHLGPVPGDYLYRLLCDGKPGYGAQIVDVNTDGFTAGAVANPQLPLVSEDFEAGDGGFTAVQGLWSHGTPPVEVTAGAFDGALCWGVGMDGDYGDDESDMLISPVYDLTGVTVTRYRLSFHFYCATEPGFDGVNLEVSDGGPFTVLAPLDGYTDQSLSGLGNRPGWAGDTGRWRGAVFDISAFVGGSFQFRLNWGSDGGITGQGFYLDGIAFGSGDRVTDVAEPPVPARQRTTLRTWPNPFNPRVQVAFGLAEPGHVQVAVFDVRGRRVRSLWDGVARAEERILQWDGRDGGGRPVPSGTYFVMVAPRGGQMAISKVVLAR